MSLYVPQVALSSLIADLQTSYRATVHFIPPTDTSTTELAQAARPKIAFGARTLVHEWSITAKVSYYLFFRTKNFFRFERIIYYY